MSAEIQAHKHTFMNHTTPVWRPAGEEHGRSCSWCGSAHPAELAAAIRSGATLSMADMKYGWPHKFYITGMTGAIKFYTEHLQDAEPDDRVVIERAMGLNVAFNVHQPGDVTWKQFEEK